MNKNERFSRGNLVFLFIVAFLAGAITKKAISNHVRIGFDDPTTIIERGELYDIDELEQKLLREGIPTETSAVEGEIKDSDIVK